MARFDREGRKKEQRNKLILGIIVIVIMVGGGLGVINSAQNLGGTKVKYGDLKFYLQETKWVVKIDKKIVAFYSHPLEVEYLNLSNKIIELIQDSDMIYLTNSPTSVNREYIAIARYDFNAIFDAFLAKPVINAFTLNVTPEIPVITCEDATQNAPVVYFVDSNHTQISLNNSCVLLEAESSNDYFRLVNRLLYGLLGIM